MCPRRWLSYVLPDVQVRCASVVLFKQLDSDTVNCGVHTLAALRVVLRFGAQNLLRHVEAAEDEAYEPSAAQLHAVRLALRRGIAAAAEVSDAPPRRRAKKANAKRGSAAECDIEPQLAELAQRRLDEAAAASDVDASAGDVLAQPACDRFWQAEGYSSDEELSPSIVRL